MTEEARQLSAEEIAELREEPMLVHTFDAHRITGLLLDAAQAASPSDGLRDLRDAADYAAHVLDLALTGDEEFDEPTIRRAIAKVRVALEATGEGSEKP